MSRDTILITLRGGPHDGHTDTILAPPPQLLLITWCDTCQREHAHAVDPVDQDLGGAPVYLLDVQTDAAAVYRILDMDATLEAIVETTMPLPAPVTYAGRRSATYAGMDPRPALRALMGG